MEKDVLIIGAGAAGLMCALTAGRRGRRVIVLERNACVGRKILISGGGRSNFTNRWVTSEAFLSENPHFSKSALSRFTPADFIAMVERHAVPYYEKTLGQLFCKTSSKEIVRLLESECRAVHVDIRLDCRVTSVEKHDRFIVQTESGQFDAASLVIATGGLSFARLGATDFGYRIARQFGLPIVDPAPALVPFLWRPDDAAAFAPLAGVSAEVEVRCRDKRFREAMLFTHRGLSGPAILQISSYWRAGDEIAIDLLPGLSAEVQLKTEKVDGGHVHLHTWLSRFLPQRLAEAWCARYHPSRPIRTYTDKALEAISRDIHDWRIFLAGTEGYDKAEVTRGGVDTRSLSSKTFEVQGVRGLYFIGEVLDVTGHLGGYNFQWAWASGVAAGEVV